MRTTLILVCLASPAAADLTFCNETDVLATVAIGYSDDKVWTSEGWWRITPGQCRAVVKGNLPKRYYYWRATTKAETIAEGGYHFCTQSDAFTIAGDADCEGRGFKTAGFRQEDIGEAPDHTIVLSWNDVPDTAPPQAERPQADQGPGTFGEPYTVVAEFRGCWAVAEELECEFVADGWHYIASETGPTDPGIIEALGVFSEGMRLQISGDMIAFSGERADVTIREVEPAPATLPPASNVSTDGLAEHIQGIWDSDSGDGYTWIVERNFLREIYDANIMRESFFEIAATCAASNGQGPVIIAWPEPDEGEGPSCYLVTETAQRHLAVRDVVEGNDYSFSYSN